METTGYHRASNQSLKSQLDRDHHVGDITDIQLTWLP